MAKFYCKCGNLIRISGEIPNSQEWLTLSDVEYNSLSQSMNLEDLYPKLKSFFLCEVCGRIWFYKDGFDKKPILYRIEESEGNVSN
jgi:hypothetical protein